ncbi:MAG: glucose-1-phosphate thymidylyltransferase [Chloroflexota bacterium]|nr:glucose-1-phosphate thymidylyltransferase [Chloroflexota bacterium]
MAEAGADGDRNVAPEPGRRKLKGLVLAGGKGSRLRPLTATGAKQLVPVANKPVLHYALEQLVAAGVEEIGIVTGDTADQVRASIKDGSAFGARVTYLPQSAPLGLAHAIITAREWLGDGHFCMFLGDNFLKGGITGHALQYMTGTACAQILLKRVDNPSAFGVAMLDGGGRVTRLVEKPTDRISDLAVIGVYFFGPEVHTITPHLVPSARGELEITDAIQGLIDAGHAVGSSVIDDDWIDTGKKDDMLEANRLVLATLSRRIDGTVDADSRVIGPVVIEAGAIITRSSIRGPAIIGAGATVTDAYVGPFTAIGAGCELLSCEIEHSIILEQSKVRNVDRPIADSLIGREVVVDRSPVRPRAIRLMVGDHSVVEIG